MIDIQSVMREHGITPQIMYMRFKPHVTPELLTAWINGTKRPPPYAALSFKALQRGLEPIDHDKMRKHVTMIGAAPSNIQYWIKMGRYPIMARFAVAYYLWEKSPRLNQADKNILLRIDMYRYAPIGLWFVAKPMQGYEPPPKIRRVKVERLIHHGMVRMTARGEAELTPKGRLNKPLRD